MSRLRSTTSITRRACALTATAALLGAALPASAAAGPGSGAGTWVWVLAAIGAAVLVLAVARLRGALPGSGSGVTDVADGREILIARGRRVTEQLTALTDVIAEREDEIATRSHQRALDVVTEARGRIGRTAGHRVQARAHHDLDEAEWLIGVLRARLDGFVEPVETPAGVPATCFFDAEHGFAAVEVDLDGIALQRVPVRTCASCAVALVRGDRPQVGTVAIGGHTIPWPAAPRWCGSHGWAVKDLRHLSYDGVPIFIDPPRSEQPGRRRQTVAERARGVRARVVSEGPRVLPEDEPHPLAPALDETAEHDGGERRSGERRTGERRAAEPRAAETVARETAAVELQAAEPRALRSAFDAMGDDAPAVAEAAPVATGDTPAD